MKSICLAVALLCLPGIATGQEQSEGSRPGEARGEQGAGTKSPNVLIRFKVFNADSPRSAPLAATEVFPFVRPAPGVSAIPLEDFEFKQNEDDGFYHLTVPRGILLETVVIEVVSQETGTNFNTAVVNKVVTAESMTFYPGASDAKGEFSFTGYISQLGTYQNLYMTLVEHIGFFSPEVARARYGDNLRDMPHPYDVVRLPGLSPYERKYANDLYVQVLETYGLISKAAPAKPMPIRTYCRCRRRCCRFRRR